MKIETKVRNLGKSNLNGVTPLELQELKEILKFLLKERSINIINKFKKDGDRVPAMFLLTQHPTNSNNEIVYDEFICKVVYIPSVLTKCINERGIITFFGNIGGDFNTVVKCHCRNMDININTFGENDSLRFVNLGVNDLHKLFQLGNTNLSDTLIIINGLTFEALTFILLSHGIKLHGGSHTRRHLLQPLELKLAFAVKDLPGYVDHYVEWFIEPDTTDFFELELKSESRLKSLKGKINNSYYNSDTYKMSLNPEFQDFILKFKQLLKIAYKISFSRDVLYTIFLKNYSLDLNDHDIKMVLNQKGIDLFNHLLNEVEKKDTDYSDTTSICTENNKAPSKAIGKRGIHTSIRNSAGNKQNRLNLPANLDDRMVKKHSRLNKFLIRIRNKLDNITDQVEAQTILEEDWTQEMISFLSSDKNIIKTQTSDMNILSEVIKTVKLVNEINSNTRRKDLIHKTYPNLGPRIDYLTVMMITYAIAKICVDQKKTYTTTISKIGSSILSHIFIEERNKFIKSQGKDLMEKSFYKSFDLFLEVLKINDDDILRIGDYFLNILMSEPHKIFVRDFNVKMGYLKGESAILNYNPSLIEEIRSNVPVYPLSMPMLCPPRDWDDNVYGGYLSNSILKKPLIRISPNSAHETLKKELLYRSINIMSKVEFEINHLFYEFLNSGKGNYLFEGEENKPYDMVLAESFLLKNKTFYIPLRADFRGRIYTDSYYLNYQGSDLSVAMIQLSEGESLTPEGFRNLYIYIANIYGESGINKLNYDKRVEWTIKNKIKILSMDPEFILGAEEKFKFTALCLLMRELEKDPSYPVKIPVFFDCTCSGIQHLAGLMKDETLGKEVNLTPQTEQDDVADIYAKLAIPINNEIRREGLENVKYINLMEVDLPRNILKKPIMTKTYNVSIEGIFEQLSEHFETKLINKVKYFHNVPSIKKDQYCMINESDLRKISTIINNTLFQRYPLIEKFYDYVLQMSKLMNEFGLDIEWSTPNGVEVHQRYLKTVLKRKLRLNNKVSVLRQYSKTDLDKAKQTNAIIPNIIHSLDANHLMKIIISFAAMIEKPLITVHDCFGTHPNNSNILREVVKCEFAELYSDGEFINKFHEKNLRKLRNNNYELTFDKEYDILYALSGRNRIIIPNPPSLGGFNINLVKDCVHIIT